MCTKKEEHNCIWLNPDLDLEEAFNNKSFEHLIKYSDDNKSNLMQIWLLRNQIDTRNVLQLGAVLLRYFEGSITDDLKSLTAFKLGELSGHLACLERILYETDQNDMAKAELEAVKLMYPQFSNYFENILVAILNKNSNASEQDLLDAVALNSQELKQVLNIMLQNVFVHYYEGFGYSLSEKGYLLARLLTKIS